MATGPPPAAPGRPLMCLTMPRPRCAPRRIPAHPKHQKNLYKLCENHDLRLYISKASPLPNHKALRPPIHMSNQPPHSPATIPPTHSMRARAHTRKTKIMKDMAMRHSHHRTARPPHSPAIIPRNLSTQARARPQARHKNKDNERHVY